MVNIVRRLYAMPRAIKLVLLMTATGTVVWAMWNRPWSSVSKTPSDIAEFRLLEARVQIVTRKVLPAVVAVQSPSGGFSSGVIISPDGLVLSQFHVSHRYSWDGEGPYRSRQPGEHTMVILSDGRKLEAELLGADFTEDLSLLKLLEPGPYSYTPVEPLAAVSSGDWVLKLGHPTGYKHGRPPVVRLGRVLLQKRERFVIDCNTVGGDSGGPIFDLNGRLVGVPHVTIAKAILGIPGPENWRPKGILQPLTIMSASTTSAIQRCMPEMQQGVLLPLDMKALEESGYVEPTEPSLAESEWTQGAATAMAFHDIVEPTRSSVIEIVDASSMRVALGTAIETDGLILTVASLLPSKPRCRLPNQIIVKAEVVGTNAEFDLALLKVPATGLNPVLWVTSGPASTAGTVLAAPGPLSKPERATMSIGVVSVPTRKRSTMLPTFFQHDMPLFTNQLGGPVIDLDGKAVGISIIWNKYGCEAIPADCIERLLPELLNEK